MAHELIGLNEAAEAVEGGGLLEGVDRPFIIGGLGRTPPGFYVAENAYLAIMKRVSYVILG